MNGAEIIDVDENEKFMEQVNETIERTFINPYQVEQASSGEQRQCERCDFTSARKSE